MKKIVIATRGSKLALWQTNHIKNLLERNFTNLKVDIEVFKTKGDKILDTPLALIGGKGLFTKELEDAMLKKEAHLAVHSLKDVPTILPDGLVLGAFTKREDPRDALLSQKYASLKDLPKGAIVGTTSLRRRMQLLNLRPDLVIKDLRGNVDTRIKKLKNGEFDAIILAAAGIKRLGLTNEVKYFSLIDEMIPAMGQAVLGIECIEDEEVLEIVKTLNDEKSEIETRVERDFVDRLQGGCQVPIGVKATLIGENIEVKAIVGLPNGKEILKEEMVGDKKDFKELGGEIADLMIQKGAKELLKRAEEIAFK